MRTLTAFWKGKVRLLLPTTGIRGCLQVTLLLLSLAGTAQECPPNIDFETGTFAGWTCYAGYVASVNAENIITLTETQPIANRQTMYTSFPGDGLDPYGGFPVNCPNGSGHSIRLGNDLGGGEAEGISYTFNVPANRDVYSLIYHYAVVFQDPNHLESQQPRMEVEITNVTDNVRIDCSSFTWHPYGSVLPGFEESPNPGTNTPVWFKNWSAVTINLDRMAGKTIRLFFKTADCTFRKHFGYAYIDVNSECSSEFTGAAYCPDDTAVNVVAPYGYEKYTWFSSDFSTVIGTGQTLRVVPPPPVGTRIAVELVPYNGYGCLDTLYAKLIDTLTVNAIAGPDQRSCNRAPIQLGAPPKAGVRYRWRPAAGLSNPDISNPLATPASTTQYILNAGSIGGGCVTEDTVLVSTDLVNDSIRLAGDAAFCVTSGDSAILHVSTAASIHWYKDNVLLLNATQPYYHVTQSGTYFAVLDNLEGCSVTSPVQKVFIDVPKTGISYPFKYTLVNTPVTLSARNFGARYTWDPDTQISNNATRSPVFSGAADQLYTVSITTATGCLTIDSQFVKIISNADIYVPTAFTPNGDGKNELLRPLLRGISELHFFRVFDRVGQLLFQTSREGEGWNGRIKGGIQSTQTVVWVAEGLGVDGKIYRRTGSTVLIQ